MKTALITGASRGIGAEIARTFARNGYRVVINYNSSKTKAEELADELTREGAVALAIKADISNSIEVKELVEKTIKTFGSIDVLVSNAGVCVPGLIMEISDDDILNMINTNLIGAMFVTREVAKQMVHQMFGRIVYISSDFAVKGGSNESVYSASKAGLVGLTKSLAKELGRSNITVNAIAPGAVKTDMLKKHSEETLKAIANESADGRLGEAGDIAALALFLTKDEAKHLTGEVITLDGCWMG